MNRSGTIVARPVFDGIWMARSAPLAYRALAKCGCSSVGQVIHHLDHGRFYPRLVHDDAVPILKWRHAPTDEEIVERFAAGGILSFTVVRNPYRRLLSAFADKIHGYQSDGTRYYGGYIHARLADYGVKWGPRSNLVDNFHGFVRFAADTVGSGVPMPADIHWAPLVEQLRHTAACAPGWSLQFVGHLEKFAPDMARALELAGLAGRLPARIPRENVATLPEVPMVRWFGPRERALVERAYAEDFRLLGYGTDPERTEPAREVDAAELNRAIGASA